MVLTEHITSIGDYSIMWHQLISKKGKLYGIGSFQQKETGTQSNRNWGRTLQNRIKARHEKKKDWKEY